jgi:hypothetical protein
MVLPPALFPERDLSILILTKHLIPLITSLTLIAYSSHLVDRRE